MGAGLDEALARLAPLVGSRAPTDEHEAVVAAVNGVLGDYLHATGNPLAIPMAFRRDGATLDAATLAEALPDAGPRLLVMVHGSSMSDRQWRRAGHDHGAALERDLGLTRVDLHYNTGRHISTNGAELAVRLEELVETWPTDVEELVFVCHSMGGLVTRSACREADRLGLGWRRRLSAVVFLGTPHHGSPLERAGNHVDRALGISCYSAPFAAELALEGEGVTADSVTSGVLSFGVTKAGDGVEGVSAVISPSGGDGPYYLNEAEIGVESGATATTSSGSGTIVNLSPGMYTVTFSGETAGCSRYTGWDGGDSLVIETEVRAGYSSWIAMRCE